jgi:hypothetical protein
MNGLLIPITCFDCVLRVCLYGQEIDRGLTVCVLCDWQIAMVISRNWVKILRYTAKNIQGRYNGKSDDRRRAALPKHSANSADLISGEA